MQLNEILVQASRALLLCSKAGEYIANKNEDFLAFLHGKMHCRETLFPTQNVLQRQTQDPLTRWVLCTKVWLAKREMDVDEHKDLYRACAHPESVACAVEIGRFLLQSPCAAVYWLRITAVT